MVIGSRVDEALTDYYRHQLEHREPLPVDEVLQRYRRGWKDKLEADRERQPIVWDEFDQGTALERGAQALEVTFEQLVPKLGIPVAVQRRLEFTLAPALEWSILCYLDLETEGQTPSAKASSARSWTTRSRAATRSTRPRPTATRRQACTSPGAGSRASPPNGSRSRRALRAGKKRKQ